MCFINDYELEGEGVHNVDVHEEDLIARNEDLELNDILLVQQHSLRRDVGVEELIVPTHTTALSTLLVVVQDGIHVSPFLHRTLPMR